MVTPLMFALYLACLLLGTAAQTTNPKSPLYVRQESRFISANVGDNVTMRCFYKGIAVMFYWCKQTLGQKPRLISSYYKHEENSILLNEFKDNSRFSLATGDGKYHLTISDLRISDSATYYCTGSYSYDLEFAEGVTVSVKGPNKNIPTLVHQLSPSETIQPMTLNCTVHTGTCDGEHSVYWFKDSEESHPGLIYTHGDRNDQCERKPNTQTHTCVYNLPMKSLNLSHAETYYCAVASCGQILFEEEEKLDSKHEVGSLDLVYFLTGALAFTTILVIFLAYNVYTMYKTYSCQSTDSKTSAALTPNAVDCQDSDNLHYAALREPKVNRSIRQRSDTQSECVYSSVRQ